MGRLGDPDRIKNIKIFILRYWAENQISPTIRDIARHMNVSTSIVSYYIKILEGTWLVKIKAKSQARSIIPISLVVSVRNSALELLEEMLK